MKVKNLDGKLITREPLTHRRSGGIGKMSFAEGLLVSYGFCMSYVFSARKTFDSFKCIKQQICCEMQSTYAGYFGRIIATKKAFLLV
jgi:hypothetical protein